MTKPAYMAKFINFLTGPLKEDEGEKKPPQKKRVKDLKQRSHGTQHECFFSISRYPK